MGFPPLGVRIAKVFTDSNLAVQIAHGVLCGGSRVTVSLGNQAGRTHSDHCRLIPHRQRSGPKGDSRMPSTHWALGTENSGFL